MNKKKLNKKVWYSSELDENKVPILPPIAETSTDLNGLHEGELFLHNSDEDPSIWIRTVSGKIQRLKGTGENISYWELMTDENGNKYIFTKYHIVTQLGMTMYSGGDGLNLPSIYDGLPIDSQTIYWDDVKDSNGVVVGKILKAKTGGGGGSGGSADFSNVLSSGSGNAYTSFILSEDKKTLTFVKGEKFALSSELESKWTADEELINNWNTAFGWGNHANAGYALQKSLDLVSEKLNNFLNGSDTDSIINKWKELEVFLGGLTESDNLATILSSKANQSSLDETNRTLATKWTQDDAMIANWDAAFSWGNHSKAGYAAKSYVDSTFVTIAGNEDVTGLHDFINGLKIGGIKIHESKDGVIYIEGNLAVKGGVTMYSDDTINIPSFIESLPTAGYNKAQARGLIAFNSEHFVINNGVVSIISGGSGLNEEQLESYLKKNGYVNSLYGYALESWVLNQGYAKKTDFEGKYVTISGNEDVTGIHNFTNGFKVGGNRIYESKDGIIYIDANVVLKGGLTMYGLDSSDVPSIIDSLPVASTSAKGIAQFNSTYFSVSNGVVSIKDGSVGLNESELNEILNGKGYLVSSDLGALAFKSNLLAADIPSLDWSKITSGKPTTISGYGITDAITTSNIGNQSVNYATSAGNAATATKLANSRTIWGQPFDGTGNVSGNIVMNNGNNKIFWHNDANNYMINCPLYGSSARLEYKAHSGHGFFADGGEAMTINLSGNVGIGTTSPSYKLHVEGFMYSTQCYIGASVYGQGHIELYGATPFIDFHYGSSTADHTSRLIEGLSGQLTCTGKFRIGLGYNTSTDYNFYVSGSAYVSSNLLTGGGITMYSARVLKNVVDERGLSLRELSVIKPTRYTWKDKRDERLHIGGIADDIEQVLPEVVYRTPDGVLTMDYGNASFAIASSLIQPVISHEERIARLERENRALKEEVKRLKSA